MSVQMNDTKEDNGGSGLSRTVLGVYVTSSLCTFIECLFAVYISSTNTNLSKRPSKYFSYNLVLCVGLLSGLSLVYGVVLLFVPGTHVVSMSGCIVRVFQRSLSNISCLLLSCLALDRYISICWPLRYFQMISELKCVLLSGLCWILGFMLPIIPCANQLRTFCRDGNSNITFLVSYTIVYNLGAFSMFIFYLLVIREFRNHPKKHPHNKVLAEAEAIVRLRTVKSAMRVLLLYSLLSLPHVTLPVINRLISWKFPPILLHFCHILHRIHLLLFLPMYVWANADSHEVMKASLRKLCKKITCNAQGVMYHLYCICSFMYAFFCCPNEDKRPQQRFQDEFSQVSTVSADLSNESRV